MYPRPPSPLSPLPSTRALAHPDVCGLPLKYVSLITLALQNAALSIVMHYSRVSIHPDLAYSPATAVLLNELLKGAISLCIAFVSSPHFRNPPPRSNLLSQIPIALYSLFFAIFSPDSWKLSIPATLYVVQNSLQFVAISNLPVATFQVTYQMKILTTAAFSVLLLRKKLSGLKWLALFFLAIGVAIVQLQSTTSVPKPLSSSAVGSAQEYFHRMSPLKGFGAVTAACFTSGLAGVYFEMVLKGSKTDLWVRNVQLSLFSLIPALLPILYAPNKPHHGFVDSLFHNFGPWAWATVFIQVLGGLLTAVVIKYSDNILKGFATSLSIVLSFLASVVLFEFKITMGFLIGALTVLASTWMYNMPSETPPSPLVEKLDTVDMKRDYKFSLTTEKDSLSVSGRSTPSTRSYPGTPVQSTFFLTQPPCNNPNSSSGSVLSSLGVGSFMRRKPSGLPPPYSTPPHSPAYSPITPTYTPAYTPSAPPSRTSSAASLLNLVSLSRNGSVLGLGDIPTTMMEMGGKAENGEVVHLTSEIGDVMEANESPFGLSFGKH